MKIVKILTSVILVFIVCAAKPVALNLEIKKSAR